MKSNFETVWESLLISIPIPIPIHFRSQKFTLQHSLKSALKKDYRGGGGGQSEREIERGRYERERERGGERRTEEPRASKSGKIRASRAYCVNNIVCNA